MKEEQQFTSFDQQVLAARRSMSKLVLYRNLLQKEPIKLLARLLDSICRKSPSEIIIDDYHHFLSKLLAEDDEWEHDIWQSYLIDQILTDENQFSLNAEKKDFSELPDTLIKYAVNDLNCLQTMFSLSGSKLRAAVIGIMKEDFIESIDEYDLVEWHIQEKPQPECHTIRQILQQSDQWGNEIKLLSNHYRNHGCGIFARYSALTWGREEEKTISGVASPDPVTFNDLVGIGDLRDKIMRNTEYFLRGLPAQNVLLYGKRGTGKSSLVKAVLNHYHKRGLRMIELSNRHLLDLPQIIKILRDRGLRFIIFLDDLSFEEYQTEYKELKAIFEGTIDSQPDNVLIYATTNRRHLIKEYFSDRKGDEIHGDDTRQEKLSVADRFGLKLLFPAYNQDMYLYVVESLARQKKIEISREELHRRALRWEKYHDGFSGRTARQFVDELKAEIEYNRGV